MDEGQQQEQGNHQQQENEMLLNKKMLRLILRTFVLSSYPAQISADIINEGSSSSDNNNKVSTSAFNGKSLKRDDVESYMGLRDALEVYGNSSSCSPRQNQVVTELCQLILKVEEQDSASAAKQFILATSSPTSSLLDRQQKFREEQQHHYQQQHSWRDILNCVVSLLEEINLSKNIN